MKKLNNYTATKNACKLCTPLGACFAFKGVENTMTILHGSQGCSTYIRRYMISHFKEPIDIASSNFSEDTAVFGGSSNLKISIDNIIKQYNPDLIGVATTCLSETIGDDVDRLVKEYLVEHKNEKLPKIIPVSTPSYNGTHHEGFISAVYSLVDKLTIENKEKTKNQINVFCPMISPTDLRHLKEILSDFGVAYTLCPDYSETLDGGLWGEYKKIPTGGTTISSIENMGSSEFSIEFGRVIKELKSAGTLLENRFSIPNHSLGIPIGINESDKFFNTLQTLSGVSIPKKYVEERDRAIDAYADGHKYVFGQTACVYGEEDLVVGLASFLDEIGIIPSICATGGRSGHLKNKLKEVIDDYEDKKIKVIDNADFQDIEDAVEKSKPDLIIGNSKGYKISRKLDIPLIRVGFPIHDRFGASRILHLGYRGAVELFDRIVNVIIEKRQETSEVGYTYI